MKENLLIFPRFTAAEGKLLQSKAMIVDGLKIAWIQQSCCAILLSCKGQLPDLWIPGLRQFYGQGQRSEPLPLFTDFLRCHFPNVSWLFQKASEDRVKFVHHVMLISAYEVIFCWFRALLQPAVPI